jgi:hypothetical protein
VTSPAGGDATLGSRLRKALLGWIVIAGGLTLVGLGAFAGARAGQAGEISRATQREWLQYASEVEQGLRRPSGQTTRLLTEAAIAQHAHARAAVDLLQFLGAGVALLGLILALDLIRFRRRHTTGVDSADR